MIKILIAAAVAHIAVLPAPTMMVFSGPNGRHMFYISARNKRRLARRGADVLDFFTGDDL